MGYIIKGSSRKACHYDRECLAKKQLIEDRGFDALNNLNRVLGVNLDGKSKVGFGWEGSSFVGLDQDPMIHDLEKEPIGGVDGKKRQRTNVFSDKVSETFDSK